jgi:hypothetical protein
MSETTNKSTGKKVAMVTTVTGASDDLIEIEGQISEEFSAYGTDEDEPKFLGFSDGTLLRVTYDGLWRFSLVSRGSADYSKVDGCEDEDTNDVVTLKGDIRWVCYGEKIAKARA